MNKPSQLKLSEPIYSLNRDIQQRAETAAKAAAQHAAAVDRDARFPSEAYASIKSERLLGILVPTELGGEGASISDSVDVCYTLARACASTGMIYAMHQVMVACLVRHASESAWHRAFLGRLSSQQLLLASSTTEGQGGGDLRRSQCAVEPVDNNGIAVEKNASVISYGAQADAIVTTARRSPDAAASDQVLVAFEKGKYKLEPLLGWDSLGMRGTCSSGFILRGRGEPGQVLPEHYQKIHAQTGMPVSHMLWGATWTGIAASAAERARAFLRVASRKGGQMPPGATHLTRATATLSTLRAAVASAARRYESIAPGDEQLESLEFQASMNLLKVTASELAIATVNSALQATGLAGYRNDGDFSVTRQLRDALSSSVMINNDRIIANVATPSLLIDVPNRLTS
jgi:acyl-CoA dehydrogenase